MGFMSTYFDVTGISSDKQYLARIGAKEGIAVYNVEMTRKITPLKDLVAIIKLYKLIKKYKPLIIHTHTPKAGLLGMIAAGLANAPIRLHTVAGMPLMEARGVKRKILNITEWLTYRLATKVYPNSKNLKQFIVDNKFCLPAKLKVIGNGSSNGIDADHFKPNGSTIRKSIELKSELRLTDDNFVFLFVGRLVKDKGIEELVKAFLTIHKQYPHIRLLLVGPFEHELDPLSASCVEQIEINENILSVGFQSDVRPYLMLSNALVFPSYREGFPNVPMQAGCFDLPCIVSDINGCNEIIEDGENGLIIPVKDTVALKVSMERLLTDKLLLLKLKANARRMIVDRYEQRYFWSLLLDEYQELLKNHGTVSQDI